MSELENIFMLHIINGGSHPVTFYYEKDRVDILKKVLEDGAEKFFPSDKDRIVIIDGLDRDASRELYLFLKSLSHKDIDVGCVVIFRNDD